MLTDKEIHDIEDEFFDKETPFVENPTGPAVLARELYRAIAKAARLEALGDVVDVVGQKSGYYQVGSSNFSVCCEMMRAIRALIEKEEA